eukprot:scaffold31942_cov155-Skeletonema_dohrnii-CCMP3373.AAC.2
MRSLPHNFDGGECQTLDRALVGRDGCLRVFDGRKRSLANFVNFVRKSRMEWKYVAGDVTASLQSTSPPS